MTPPAMGMIKGNSIWNAGQIPDRDDTRVELTDLIRFRDHWYCGFCEGLIHLNHPSGRAWIIRSADGVDWQAVKTFDWDGGDVRDPMFSITAEGQLMVNSSIYFVSQQPRLAELPDRAGGTYVPDEAKPERKSLHQYFQLDNPGTPESEDESQVARQSVTWLTDDGLNWGSVHACPTGVNNWRWQVRWYQGMGYSVGYCGKDTTGTLYRTRDGRNWRILRDNFFPNGRGSEASIAFGNDGSLYCLLRQQGHSAQFGVSPGPYYQDCKWRELKVDCGAANGGVLPTSEVFKAPMGGPKMITRHDGRLVAVARMRWPWREHQTITLFDIDPDSGLLSIVHEIEGTSYAGIWEHQGDLWISYRSLGADNIGLVKVPAAEIS